jgi:alpha-glucoside transport system permease protein
MAIQPSASTSAAVSVRAPQALRLRFRRSAGAIALHGIALLICALWLVPTLSLLVASVRPAALMLSSGWWDIFTSPEQFTINNYEQVLESGGLARSFLNSLVIVVPVTLATVLVGAVAGYAFASMRFPGERLLLTFTIGLLALPVQVTLVPVLQLFSTLDLAGTFVGAWIAYTGYFLPFAIFLMTTFFRRIPRDIIEAAEVDGASPPVAWLRIAMPMAAPALASLATLVFVWTWNDLLISLVYLGGSPSVAPMPVTIANLIGSQGQGQELLAAGAVISLLLPVTVFFALQRYFVRGIVAGAIKG